MTKVAVIGTGRMGSAMVVRLAEAGVPVVVYNRTLAAAEKVAAASGASVASSPSEAASSAEVVLVSLADDRAVMQTYHGEDGLIAGLTEGTIVLETSTIDPLTVLDLSGPVASRGAFLLDTPVSGSVSGVEHGVLTVMAGGDPQALDRARPILASLATNVFHVGGLGAGATMKLAVNGIVHGLNQAVSEALVLAERAGIERSVAYEVFANSAVAAPFVNYKRAAYEHPEQVVVAFSLDLVAKDLQLITGLAQRLGVPFAQAATNLAVVEAACSDGFGGRDISAVADYLRTR